MKNYPKHYLYKRIVQAKIFMDRNYAEQIDVPNIAHAASFSRFHFIRLFKRIYEKTPYQYLTAVRIEAAKQLLKNNQSVSTVCFAVGFESLSSFSGLFKRITGLTPSAFLAEHHAHELKSTKRRSASFPIVLYTNINGAETPVLNKSLFNSMPTF